MVVLFLKMQQMLRTSTSFHVKPQTEPNDLVNNIIVVKKKKLSSLPSSTYSVLDSDVINYLNRVL